MVKKQIGARVSALVLKDFNELRKRDGLSLGEAVQVLMETANSLGSIQGLKAAVESSKDRIQQKIRLGLEAELNRLEAFYEDDQKDPPEDRRTFILRAGEARRIIETIIDLVGQTADQELVKRARSLVAEASRFYGAS